jgi:hypothetical protein
VLPLPPLSLPYSPEFEPRADPDAGRATLVEAARISGGIDRTSWDDVFSARGLRNRQMRDLLIPLAVLLLCLHLVEITGRRLLLFDAAPAWLRARMPSRARLAALRPRVRFRRADRPPAPAEEPALAHVAPRVEASPDPAAVSSAMARAKTKARSRVER